MSEAVRGVDTYWDRFLAIEPVFATAVGDARFDDVLPTRLRRAARSGIGCILGCLRLPPVSTPRVLISRSGGRCCWPWRWRAVSWAA